jgi:hypothetical protein
MDNLIHVFYSEIENAEIAFREYTKFKIEGGYYNEHPNLFSLIQGEKLDYSILNDELEYKIRVFSEIIAVRDKVKSIVDSEQQIANLSQLNQIILEVVPPQARDSELVNPFREIIFNEMGFSFFSNNKKFVLIIHHPNIEDVVFKVDTSDEKDYVALKICKLIAEVLNDEDIVSDLDEIMTSESIQFLKSINIPIENRFNYYNHTILKKQIFELLYEYWDIDYTVIYEISNAKKVISEDDFLMRLHDYSDYQIKENSVECKLNIFEDVTGSDVDPLDPNFKTKLQDKVEKIAWKNMSLDIIQLLGNLCENPKIKIRSAEFPKMKELKELKEKLEKLM